MNGNLHDRLDEQGIKVQSEFITSFPYINYFLDKVPDIVLIINEQRQIVYCNSNLLIYLSIESTKDVYGKRTGELLKCENAFEHEDGCGSTQFCKFCGAFKAIESAKNKNKDIQECRIIQKDTGLAFDLRVWTSPIAINGNDFIMFSLIDISDEKRKEVLEKTFFHDILNTAIGVKAVIDIYEQDIPNGLNEFKSLMIKTTTKLLEEINSQKQLFDAENLCLAVNFNIINSLNLLNEIIACQKNYSFAQDIRINILPDSDNVTLFNDKVLLGRVLSNLIKNAIEAESVSGEVNVGCKLENDKIHFLVQNKNVMPVEVQMQLFRRSFSTKGKGRGIGTYSVKLLTEKYLRGKVEFTSNEIEGTIFNLYLPINNMNENAQDISSGQPSI